MSKNCQHCDAHNPEGYFNCPECGERASESLWTVNTIIRENNPFAKAIRQDRIDISTQDMDSHIKRTKKRNEEEANKRLHNSVKWDDSPVTVKS